jgi:hypothetical protein
MPANPSRLIAYAETCRCEWRWETKRKGDGWEGVAQLIPGPDDPKPRFSAVADTEQEALDRAIRHAIDHDAWRRRNSGGMRYEPDQ